MYLYYNIGAEEGQEVEWQFHDGVQVGGGDGVHCQPRIHQPGLSVHPLLHLTPSPTHTEHFLQHSQQSFSGYSVITAATLS